ncbi:hypothetical protein CR103_14025 [Massilia psychrophila]|uniref:Apea-like HEPN domain-containing protein n=2 Tax=Massilia psychrophila TaxID=1603353 RepID=A0A2G8SZI0_9BURK|nr:hypothetical protein CR103_14025 [Massilia psychrophila]
MAEMALSMSLTNGRVSIAVGDYEFYADALFGLLDHSYTIDEETLYREFESAVRDLFRESDSFSDPKKLLLKFDKRCGALLAKKSTFVVITSVNLKDAVPRGRTVNQCAIRFHKTLPRKFRSARAALLKVENSVGINVENDGYLFVEVTVTAVNDYTAFEMAMEALAVYRGLIQLHVSKTINQFAGPTLAHRYPAEPQLKLGNIHTVHTAEGGPIQNAHWFEETINKDPAIEGENFAAADDGVRRFLRKMTNSSPEFSQFCTKFIAAYTTALDTRDADAKLVRFWLCLELLTGADDAKNIIKRIAFFYSNQEVVVAQLKALRSARNSHVHAGAKPPRVALKNFVLVGFIENLIVFVVSNHFKFDNRQQWWDFMSTTTDIKSIDEQIARLRMVKKFARPARGVPEQSDDSHP